MKITNLLAMLAIVTACSNNNVKQQENMETTDKAMSYVISKMSWTRQPESYVTKGNTVDNEKINKKF